MKRCFRRIALVTGIALSLAGCGNRETQQALQKAAALENQQQYSNANDVLVAALRGREAEIRAQLPTPAPTDEGAIDDLTKKVQSDPEILKMERAQVPLYLHLQRADLASAVYSDILAGDPNDTVVFDLLKDPSTDIRTSAIRVLVLTGQPAAVGPLSTATKDSDQEVRRAAVAALGTIKSDKAVPPLIAALKDPYWFARSEAAGALGRQGDERAIPPLLDAVADSDKTVESSSEDALVALSSLKGASTEDFAKRLDDPNPKIAAIATVCLALQHDPRAGPALLKMVNSSDAKTRVQAVKAYGEAGDASSIAILRPLLKDPDIDVRGWSIIGLGKLNDQASIPTLQAIAADSTQPQSIRDAATAAVNHLTHKPADTSSSPDGQ